MASVCSRPTRSESEYDGHFTWGQGALGGSPRAGFFGHGRGVKGVQVEAYLTTIVEQNPPTQPPEQHSLAVVHSPPSGAHSDVASSQVPSLQMPPQQSAFVVHRPSVSMQLAPQRSSVPVSVTTGAQMPEQH